MRLSVGIPTCKEGLNFPLPFAKPAEVVRIIQWAEELGFHSVWGNDHITAPRYVREQFGAAPNFFEPLVTLAAASQVTKTIRLATSVIVMPMREPVYLAKQVATLDAFSNGRMILGIGVGAYREEFEAIKPDLRGADRGTMVEEGIKALLLLFGEKRASFRGKYYHFEGIEISPKPIQQPFPIYVGGNNVNAIRRAAELGHGWLPASLSVDDIRKGVEKLWDFARAAGRDPSEIDIAPQVMVTMGEHHEEAVVRFKQSQMYKHMMSLKDSTLRDQDLGKIEEYNLVGTPDEVIEKIHRLADAGVTHCAAMNFISQTPTEMMEQMQYFAERVLPSFRTT
jgi:probable F420-dependent oxidoreductase